MPRCTSNSRPLLRGLALLLLPALTLFPACTNKTDHTVFTYGQEHPANSLRGQSMTFFKDELQKRSNGRIRVEVYCSGVLGNERELMDLVATGVLQGTRGGYFADANPKFNLLTLPFLVGGWDEALRLVNSDFMKEINDGAHARGWHVPATGISQGFRAHTNSTRPIHHPDDLKGLKMRVPAQQVFVKTARSFGALPQEIPAVEIYQALQTGVVDGQDNPPSNIWDYKIYEVSKFMTVTNYATGPDPLMVNLEWYESLPPDLQTIFDEVAREAIAFSDELNRKKEQEYIEQLGEKLEINYVRGDALQPFRDAVKSIYDGYVNDGSFTWDEINRARASAKGQP